MNYLAFAGIADLDNMYITACSKIEAVKIIYDEGNAEIISKLLTYAKEAHQETLEAAHEEEAAQ